MAINWAKKLQQIESIGEKVPEGKDWFTAKEFQENGKFGQTRSHILIRELIKKGKLEVHKGSEWNRQQKQLTRKVWYRFV